MNLIRCSVQYVGDLQVTPNLWPELRLIHMNSYRLWNPPPPSEWKYSTAIFMGNNLLGVWKREQVHIMRDTIQ